MLDNICESDGFAEIVGSGGYFSKFEDKKGKANYKSVQFRNEEEAVRQKRSLFSPRSNYNSSRKDVLP